MNKIHPLKYYDDHWKFVDTIKIDGYGFGDRLLEGVWFILKWDGKRYIFDRYADKYSSKYMDDLNETKWQKAAERYVKETDIVYSVDDSEEELIRGELIPDDLLEEAENAQ